MTERPPILSGTTPMKVGIPDLMAELTRLVETRDKYEEMALLLAEAVEILDDWAMAFPDEPATATAEFKRRAERALGKP